MFLQFEQSQSEWEDLIRDLSHSFGRKHFRKGVGIRQMELMGVLMPTMLMKTLPQDEIEGGRFESINKAFIDFFWLIVYYVVAALSVAERSGFEERSET